MAHAHTYAHTIMSDINKTRRQRHVGKHYDLTLILSNPGSINCFNHTETILQCLLNLSMNLSYYSEILLLSLFQTEMHKYVDQRKCRNMHSSIPHGHPNWSFSCLWSTEYTDLQHLFNMGYYYEKKHTVEPHKQNSQWKSPNTKKCKQHDYLSINSRVSKIIYGDIN